MKSRSAQWMLWVATMSLFLWLTVSGRFYWLAIALVASFIAWYRLVPRAKYR